MVHFSIPVGKKISRKASHHLTYLAYDTKSPAESGHSLHFLSQVFDILTEASEFKSKNIFNAEKRNNSYSPTG